MEHENDALAEVCIIFALENMHVSSTNRCRGNPDQSVERPHIRNRLFIQNDATRFDENGSFHFRHD
jgi:hypothetical protein